MFMVANEKIHAKLRKSPQTAKSNLLVCRDCWFAATAVAATVVA
jgi:hypothetical protein